MPLDPNALLSEISERDEAAGLPPRGPAIRGPAQMRYSHEAMVDLIVQNPWIQQNQIATIFGRTPAWISVVMHTDAFQTLLEERRQELIDPEIRATIAERFQALVHRSMQVLQEKLSKPAEQIPDNLVLRAIEMGAKGLAVGGFAPAAPVAPSAPVPNRLEALADRLLALQNQVRGQVVDVTVKEIS